MQAIDVFLLLTLYRSQLNLSSDEIRTMIHARTGIMMSDQDMEEFLKRPPKTKHLVHALADKGFSPSWIQQYLGISQSSVSYHMHTQTDRPYSNPKWIQLVFRENSRPGVTIL